MCTNILSAFMDRREVREAHDRDAHEDLEEVPQQDLVPVRVDVVDLRGLRPHRRLLRLRQPVPGSGWLGLEKIAPNLQNDSPLEKFTTLKLLLLQVIRCFL